MDYLLSTAAPAEIGLQGDHDGLHCVPIHNAERPLVAPSLSSSSPWRMLTPKGHVYDASWRKEHSKAHTPFPKLGDS